MKQCDIDRIARGSVDSSEIMTLVMSEDDLEQALREFCLRLGLFYYHTHDSRGSEDGFPDCLIVSEDKAWIIFAELKNQTRKPTFKQASWLRVLGVVASLSYGRVRVFLWRPSNWISGDIEREIRRSVIIARDDR